jgi:hypothetical protein
MEVYVSGRQIPMACIFWALSLLAILPGCGDGDRLPTYPVSGNVGFPDGTPLSGGWIILESPEAGLAARGVIQPDGTFRLGTYDSFDGAVAGKQLVAVIPAAPEGYDPDKGTVPPGVHPRFMHMDTSGLEIEIDPDGENHFQIDVKQTGG